jgi:hypothetical protein
MAPKGIQELVDLKVAPDERGACFSFNQRRGTRYVRIRTCNACEMNETPANMIWYLASASKVDCLRFAWAWGQMQRVTSFAEQHHQHD